MNRTLVIDDNGQGMDKLERLLREHGFSVTELEQDEVERKRAEKALMMSQFIIDKAAMGIMRGSAEGKILSVNERWAQVLGYTPEELCSMSFFDIDPNLTPESWLKHRAKLTGTGANTFESVHRRKDGTMFPVEVTVNYLKFGDEIFSCSFTQDISKRRQAEEELRQANLIVENSPAVLFRWRAAEGWPVEMVSRNVIQFGYSPEAFMTGTVPFTSVVYHEDLERVTSEVHEYTCRGEDRFQQEYRIVTKDGAVRWIDDRTVVERDADGRITHYQGVVIDITDRKRTENVMSARMRLLEFAATHTLDELLEATLNEAEALTGSCVGFYHYLDADQNTLLLQNWSTRTKKQFCKTEGKGLHYDVAAAGVWVDCIHQRRPVIHNDYSSLPHRKGLPPGHAPVARELVVPVFRGEIIMAVLGVGNKPGDYTSEDVELVTLLADLAWEIVERKRTEEALRVSEQKCRAIVEHAPFGISRSSRDGKLLGANPAFARILKYDSPEALQSAVNHSSIQEVLFEESARRAPLVERIFEGDSWQVFENRYRCGDGSIITCKVHARRILDQGGSESEFESFLENITERLEAEKALRESEEKFRVLAETAPAAIVVYQGEKFVYVNPAATRLFGFSEEELLAMNFWDWACEDSREIVRERGLARQRGEQAPCQYEHGFVTKRGEPGWAMVSAGSIIYRGKPAGIATFIDVTEIKRTEERLQTSLAEKEILLKEVHHRVKNNLQIISALLDLQSDYIPEVHSRRFIRESQDRIRSMALVHEQLYKSEGLAFIDFAQYVDVLVTSLYQSCVVAQERIRVKVDVRDIELDIDEAIPCGLIINELVSNALKHAFPGDRSGDVVVSGTMAGDGLVSLTVADSGVGLPPGLDFLNTESLGLQIVNLLTNQLRGTIDMQGGQGVTVNICFRTKPKS
ncbi:MAG: PAS domain S-box protein [Deltaproteobacteria bacterium]|nr:PAS domain S-box protein [Deltaproteobacteria bacterium]